MGGIIAIIDVFGVFPEANLTVHVYAQLGGSGFYKWPIEEVTVVGYHYGGFCLFDMVKESLEYGFLIWFVEDHEMSFILWSRSVFEILNVLGNDLSIGDEKPL